MVQVSFQPAIVEVNLPALSCFPQSSSRFYAPDAVRGREASHGKSGPFIANLCAHCCEVRPCRPFRRVRARVRALPERFDLEIALFLIAVAVTTWYGGSGPGYLAIVLSMASLSYFFIPPLYSLQIDLVHLPRCVLYTLIAVAINVFSMLRRHTEQELRQTRNELGTKVNERTAELRMASAELETILEASPVGIMLFSRDQAIQRCNAACAHILGWRTNEIIGQFVPIAEHRRTELQAYI
jgi:PAS domain-containing protein